jgi:antitoxin (DNA-binding transcriptional repressor) of toxin-antitoxin stability system
MPTVATPHKVADAFDGQLVISFDVPVESASRRCVAATERGVPSARIRPAGAAVHNACQRSRHSKMNSALKAILKEDFVEPLGDRSYELQEQADRITVLTHAQGRPALSRLSRSRYVDHPVVAIQR